MFCHCSSVRACGCRATSPPLARAPWTAARTRSDLCRTTCSCPSRIRQVGNCHHQRCRRKIFAKGQPTHEPPARRPASTAMVPRQREDSWWQPLGCSRLCACSCNQQPFAILLCMAQVRGRCRRCAARRWRCCRRTGRPPASAAARPSWSPPPARCASPRSTACRRCEPNTIFFPCCDFGFGSLLSAPQDRCSCCLLASPATCVQIDISFGANDAPCLDALTVWRAG